MRIWLNLILGAFLIIQTITTFSQEFTMPSFVHAIDACDMDMDGNNDIIVSCAYENSIVILFNDGLGNFDPYYYEMTTGYLLCGCIDGDSKPDIITTTNSLNFIKNTGDRTLADSVIVLMEDVNFPINSIIDMNEDAWNDIFYQTNAYSHMGIIQNSGNLTFIDHIIYSGFSSTPSIGNLNIDNLPDLIVSFPAPVSETMVYMNSGNFNFSTILMIDKLISDPIIMESNNMEPEDLVLFETPSANVYFYENRGNENFEFRGNNPLINVYAVLLADHNDYNNDGYGDICYCQCPITGCNDSIYIGLNSQSWSFIEGQAYFVGTLNWFRIKSIDFNGDSFSDLYMTGYNSNNKVKILWNNGDGTFSYENPVGIKEASSSFCNVKIFPNPFQQQFTFEIELLKEGTLEISVLTTLGQQVLNLNYGRKSAGNYQETLSLPTVQNGILFLVLRLDGAIIDSEKILCN